MHQEDREDAAQEAHDRQTLRDWLAAGSAPGPPAIPREVVEAMTARHVEAYGRITGEAF